jgi:hypothetical protein
MLLHYGDHPVIELGELYLLVILGQDGATRDAWMAEHFDRLEDFRAAAPSRGQGVHGHHRRPRQRWPSPHRIMQMEGISLLDPDEDEIAGGLTPVTALPGSVDLATLDTLITAGIAASRAPGSGPHPRAAGLRAAQRAAAGARRTPAAGRPGPGRARPAAKQAR